MNNKKGNKKGNKQAGYIGAAIYSIILALPFFELFESYIVIAIIALVFMSITITGFAIDEKKRCKTLEQKQSKSKLEITDTKIEETCMKYNDFMEFEEQQYDSTLDFEMPVVESVTNGNLLNTEEQQDDSTENGEYIISNICDDITRLSLGSIECEIWDIIWKGWEEELYMHEKIYNEMINKKREKQDYRERKIITERKKDTIVQFKKTDTKIEETHKPISEAHTLKTWCLLNGEYGKLVKAEWLGEVNEQTNIDIDRVGRYSKSTAKWKCIHGHEWYATIESRTKERKGCPICRKENSYYENEGNTMAQFKKTDTKITNAEITSDERANKSFDKQKIVDIQNKIKSKTSNPVSEEATKQWFIMPLLVALGYDPYSSDIIPEYTLDVGTKRGEKVDYALQIHNQPVAIIECKQLNVPLSEKHISQLYRYFTISDVHIAILTNGDDYWFFTDSQKENIMDLEPYCTIRISESSLDELDKFARYSKEVIQYIDVTQVVRYERYISECRELVKSLKNNSIPSWLLEILAKRSGIVDIDKPSLAEYLYTEVQNEFNGYKVAEKKVAEVEVPRSYSRGESMKATMEKNKKNISNIKLEHEYVFNDYSDGDWRFHNLDYAIILGTRYEEVNGRSLLINTVKELFKHGKINREDILLEEQFSGTYKISESGEFRGAFYINEYNIYVSTSYGIGDIVKFIERLLEYAQVDNSEIKISFKS